MSQTDLSPLEAGAIGGPAAVYRRREARFAAEGAALARRSRRLSWARLVTLAGALGCLFAVVLRAGSPPAWALAGAAGLGLAFLVLVKVHDRAIRAERRAAAMARLQRRGLARLARSWDELPTPAPVFPPVASGETPATLARDLDLFGRASLFHLLDAGATPVGRSTLAAWLLAPAAPAEIVARQAAVAELAPALDHRQRLALAAGAGAEDARRAEPAPADPERFFAWAEGAPWLARRRWLVWASWLLPPAALAGLAASIFGPLPWSLAALPLLVNLTLSRLYGRALDGLFTRIDAGAQELRAYAAALTVAAEGRFAGVKLTALADALGAPPAAGTAAPRPAARELARLARRVEIADARHGSFHVIPQILVLWDFHALRLLEQWQAGPGRRARRWLEALGEIEALAALAGLAHDEPGWAFPAIAPPGGAAGAPRVAARALGHPLIADAARVGNDVEVGPAGSFLLVTGSNMSGKSTLLRALGINAALAQAGGPVCAAAMTLPPLALGTSILVEDSLADGVSFFLAEVLRIRRIVELARAAPAAGRTLLFLIDEPLRGTNSRERRAASRRVLGHLLAAGAIGAVATHDLELAAEPALAAAARQVHFRETFAAGDASDGGDGGGSRPAMTFDYRLRPGLATTSNALALLAMVGLGDEPAAGVPE